MHLIIIIIIITTEHEWQRSGAPRKAVTVPKRRPREMTKTAIPRLPAVR